MNWAAREREQREVNGGPRTRREWAAERASETGLYPAGLAVRAGHAYRVTQNPYFLSSSCKATMSCFRSSISIK